MHDAMSSSLMTSLVNLTLLLLASFPFSSLIRNEFKTCQSISWPTCTNVDFDWETLDGPIRDFFACMVCCTIVIFTTIAAHPVHGSLSTISNARIGFTTRSVEAFSFLRLFRLAGYQRLKSFLFTCLSHSCFFSISFSSLSTTCTIYNLSPSVIFHYVHIPNLLGQWAPNFAFHGKFSCSNMCWNMHFF